MSVYEASELRERYEGMTVRAVAKCTFETVLVGGQPATDKGLEMFCRHKLGLDGQELADAVKRIRDQEIGDRDATNGGEVKEAESYGVNCLRHDDDGACWLGNWQIKACLKQAASRLGIFKKAIGTKGDMAEMGRAEAFGISAGSHRERIRIMNPDGSPYMGNQFEKFMGRVNTPQGAKSIVHDSETAPAGCQFEFEFRMPGKLVTEEQLVSVFSAAMVCGLGSAKAMERGKFRIDRLELFGDFKGKA